MLQNRLIPVLFLKHGYLVRSEGFKIHQNLGNPISQVERYNAWDVDELIYIDITPDETYEGGREDLGIQTPHTIFDIITAVSNKCFMPLAIGGRIRSLEDIRQRLKYGADKITINTAAIENPSFITEASKMFGAQCIVVSIDVFEHVNGKYEVYSHLGKSPTGKDPVDWAKEVESLGAGEILVNSINRDGAAQGYDCRLIKNIVDAVNIPVVALGGVGVNNHFVEGLVDGGASAVAAGNLFHFKEMSYMLAKKDLKKKNLNVR